MQGAADMNFDIIVIGAGPAGSAAATWAARQGRQVALVDKAAFPRNKLCGGLFTERSRSYYTEIFGQDFDLSKVVTRSDIAFWYQSNELAVLHNIPPLHLTMRLPLDYAMFQHAITAGAADYTDCPIAEITDKTVTFRDGRTISGAVLIGTDGVNSVVARYLFGAPFNKRTIGFGLEIEVPETIQKPEVQPLRIDFAAATWGYGWSFPKHASTTVGVGGLHQPNPHMKEHMTAYLESLGLDPTVARFKGHYLPFGDYRKVPGKANVLLAGDAAGMVDPITGEGIAYAMKSGQIAAQAACDALDRQAAETALFLYVSSLKPLHRNLQLARHLRAIIFAPKLQKPFINTFRRSGTVRMKYMQLLAGKIEYPELARGVLTRIPRYFVNALRR